ncbi:MAG: hypothetical protein KKA05_07775 [Alphaproteobacteria bacterium]|nr:hypothetical protein [Alphaproteobacteria bacterium]MBU0858366.1 hypothetical protein [Alphaproteobacteria bacterium]
MTKKAGIVPFMVLCAVLGAGGMVTCAAPGQAYAQANKNNVPDFLKPRVAVPACKTPDGKLKPVYGCAGAGPVTEMTLAAAQKIIYDRETFHRCQHGRQQQAGNYNRYPTVGWGTYVDTDEEEKAGKCPPMQAMQNWFIRDVTHSYKRAHAQAKAINMDNDCMVRTLTVVNHQLGDFPRKYPDTWKKLQQGQTCSAAENLLAWSWYQQTCERTLDMVVALSDAGKCVPAKN